MKKIVLLLIFVIATGGNAWAQKGRHGVGVFGGMIAGSEKYTLEKLNIGLKYTYGVSNVFEIEPWVAYCFSQLNTSNNVGSSSLSSGSYYYKLEDYKLNFSGGVNVNAYLTKSLLRPFVSLGVAAHGITYPKYEIVAGGAYYKNGQLVQPNNTTHGGEQSTEYAARGGGGLDFRISYHSYLQAFAYYDTYARLFTGLSYIYKF